MNWLRVALCVLVPLMLQAGTRFDPVKDVPVSVSAGVLSVTVPPGVHLKVRMFRVVLASGGALRLGTLPPPTDQDDAGGPVWRGIVKVGLNGNNLEDPVRLVITYQPCTEGPDGMCFLPVRRTLTASVADIPAQSH